MSCAMIASNTAAVVVPSKNGLPSCCHFVQNSAKRKQVGPSIQFLSQRLLGGHVGDGAQHRSITCQLNLARKRLSFPTSCELRQPKIQNLGLSPLGDEQVRRFDVSVDDPLTVGRIQRVGKLDS